MIEQHMYTRSREGLTSTAVGYDSIAKSSGLSIGDVQNDYLRSLYKYSVPNTVFPENPEDYPKSVYGVPGPDGYFILGQNKYKIDEYSQNTRSAFFAHQYYIPATEIDEFYKYPEKLFRVSSFEGTYDLDKGRVLPAVANLEYHDHETDKKELLLRLGISDELFQKLLLAVFMSVKNGKIVYVLLDLPVTQLTSAALQLLELIYKSMPYGIRRQLGFNTYTNNTRAHQKMKIVFLENGSLEGQSVNNQYVFDFGQGHFENIDQLPLSDHFFSIITVMDEQSKLNEFYQFIEQSTADFADGEKNDLGLYEQLAQLYHHYSTDEGLRIEDETRRIHIYQLILPFVRNDSLKDKKPILFDILRTLFINEFGHNSKVASEKIKNIVIQFYRQSAITLNDCSAYLASCWINRLGREKALSALDELRADQELLQSVMNYIHKRSITIEHAKKALEMWMEKELKLQPGLQEQLALLQKWIANTPFIFTAGEFSSLKEKFKISFERSIRGSRSPVRDLYDLTKTLQSADVQEEFQTEYKNFLTEALPLAFEQFFLRADLKQWIEKDIDLLGVLFESIPYEYISLMRIREAEDQYYFAKSLIDILGAEEDDEKLEDPFLFYIDHDRKSLRDFQTSLREILKGTISEAPFNHVMFAFYQSAKDIVVEEQRPMSLNKRSFGKAGRKGNKGFNKAPEVRITDYYIEDISLQEYDFEGIFSYIFNLPEMDELTRRRTVHSFIRWSIRTGKGTSKDNALVLDPGFKKAVENYFYDRDPEALDNPQIMMGFKSLRHRELTRMLEEIQWENANLLGKARLKLAKMVKGR
ncbi:GAP1-N2 domain-containing protein [Mesobacillus jeotgali]|uniref:GAP1-N2 domain-containing protein n=1 Tax=Mesobacillus jeotgali TaxID=129985 RepID=UPI001CFCA51C|nr:hypothetical protein [Mesobacillus jeotgali]